MVIRQRSIPGLIVILGALACTAGCTVADSREDFLRQIFECNVSADCVSGWSCRAFAMDPTLTTYCLQDCTGDADCSFDDVCGSEGFCVEPCDVEGFACRGPDFTCLRSNMMVGATKGYCQPAPTCAVYTDCGNLFDWCIADSLSKEAPDLTFAEGHNACVEGCVGEIECSDGYQCLKKGLNQHTNLNTDGVPEVCVPKCGPDNRCPIGYRCLTESLEDYLGAPPGNPELNFCVPGLPGVLLPCTEDAQCLSGLCVEDPESLDLYGATHRFCVEPCDAQGQCPSVRFECLPGEHDGESGEFCFTRELLASCEDTEDCTSPEECLDWSHFEAGQACTLPCTGFRDPICGSGFVCLPTNVPNEFGCFVGLPGMPCNDSAQCHQGYGEQTTCIGTAGQPTDADRICTKVCTHFNQCTFGPYLGNSGAPLCHSGICQPISFSCVDPRIPFECNDTMACAEVGDHDHLCTIPCDGLRTTNHTCPEQFTCAPLYQPSLEAVEYYCYVGYPTVMPCRADSECMDQRGDGSQRCVSPTGDSLAVDGVCSIPCWTDSNCAPTGPGLSLCLPGDPDPDAGVIGYCFMNPSAVTFLGEEQGHQGTFCTGLFDGLCADDHTCVDAAGNRTGSDTAHLGWRFCARHCPNGDGDCPQEPTPHRCVNTGMAANFCVPVEDAEHARGFWQECIDHRQCAGGICFQPDTTTLGSGRCTKLCVTQADCAASGDPGTDYDDSFCQDGVCKSVVTNPGGP